MPSVPAAVCLWSLFACLNVAVAQDTIHVRAGAPAWGTNVGVSPLYTLGTGPDYRIRNFYGMAVDKANRVYVHDLNAQEGNPRVDAYDANGNFLKTFGRKGSGPGEYRVVFGMAVIEDSILAAVDFGNMRIVQWLPDGTLRRTIQLDRGYTGTAWYALSSDTANLMYLRHRTWIYGPDGRALPNQPPEGQPIFVRLRPDGTIADSILAPKIEPAPDPRLYYGSYVSWENFVPNTSIVPTAMGGLVHGRGDKYSFTIQPAKGRPVRVVERDWKPVELTPDERSQWAAFGDAQKNRDGTMGGYTVPKTKPAYRRLFVDAEGRIWVSLYAPASKRVLPARDPRLTSPRIEWLQEPVYDVFDPIGRYLGRVTLPYRTGDLVQARGDRAWFFGVGPDDEHLVTAYKLTGIRGR
jgi:hypothetical protein